MKLTTKDQELYEICKQTVDAGLSVCALVGGALRTIKEREFYLSEGFKTWEEFCGARYSQWSSRYCNQLIVDEKTINALPEKTRKLVTTHSAAQALSKIPEELREQVIEIATKSATVPATATAIRRAAPPKMPVKPSAPVKPVEPPKAPQSKKAPIIEAETIQKDHTGLPIPLEIKELWDKGYEVDELMTYVSRIRTALGEASEADNQLFLEVDFSTAASNLNQVTKELQRAQPFAVCPECNGTLAKKCNTCRGRGFCSEFRYLQEPIEKRMLRPVFVGTRAERKELPANHPQYLKK